MGLFSSTECGSPGLLYQADDSTKWDSQNEFVGVSEKDIWAPWNIVVISSSNHGSQQVFSHGAYVYDQAPQPTPF